MDILNIFDDLLSDNEEMVNVIERPRRPRMFRQRRDHFNGWNNIEFVNRFRISKDSALSVLHRIQAQIAHPTNR